MLEITGTGAQITGDLSVSGSLKATTGLSSNSLTIGGSVSSATVAVIGSGAFSQDLSAKSIKLSGAQLPIVKTLKVEGGDCAWIYVCSWTRERDRIKDYRNRAGCMDLARTSGQAAGVYTITFPTASTRR